MSVVEIVLIIAGVVVCALGYLLPAKKKELNNIDEELQTIGEEEVRKLIEREVEGVKSHISDIVDETVSYAMEKTERSMDRVTNEKMMAVNEYSDTVLEEINKNHKEVLFLYDMLNDKHENLKDTVSEAARTAEEVKQTVKDVEISAKEAEAAVKTVELTVQEAQEAAKQAVREVKEYGEPKDGLPFEETADAIRIPEPEIMPETEKMSLPEMIFSAPVRETDDDIIQRENPDIPADTGIGIMPGITIEAETENGTKSDGMDVPEPVPMPVRAEFDEAGQIERELFRMQEDSSALQEAQEAPVFEEAQTPEPEAETDMFVPIAPPRVEIVHDLDGDYVAPAESKSVNIQFANGRDNGRNSNERILELHKAGKSNMAIAKELGLGIGEVKLVIDLFEGI